MSGERREDVISDTAWVCGYVAFPDSQHMPARRISDCAGPVVSLVVTFHLRLPECRIRSTAGRTTSVLRATAPEAPVNEDGKTPARHHNVRRATLAETTLHPVTGTGRVKRTTQLQLRLRVSLLPPGKVPSLGRTSPYFAHRIELSRQVVPIAGCVGAASRLGRRPSAARRPHQG